MFQVIVYSEICDGCDCLYLLDRPPPHVGLISGQGGHRHSHGLFCEETAGKKQKKPSGYGAKARKDNSMQSAVAAQPGTDRTDAQQNTCGVRAAAAGGVPCEKIPQDPDSRDLRK